MFLVTADNPYETLDNFDHRRMRSTYSTLTWRKRAHKSAWDIQRKFSVTLNAVSGLNCDIRKTNEVINNFFINSLLITTP